AGARRRPGAAAGDGRQRATVRGCADARDLRGCVRGGGAACGGGALAPDALPATTRALRRARFIRRACARRELGSRGPRCRRDGRGSADAGCAGAGGARPRTRRARCRALTDPHAPALSPRRDDEASPRLQPTNLYDRPIPSDNRGGRGRWRPGRRGGCLLLLAALAIAGAGHWAWWYRDRAHEMAPSKSRLLGEAMLPVRLWLPYPHQNLGALGKAVEHPREVLAAASRLAGLPEPAIPQLGAFGIPAARELLVEATRDGRNVRAAIRLYPATAVLIRIAGTVARNRWLAGG